jgi:hypothetical protein
MVMSPRATKVDMRKVDMRGASSVRQHPSQVRAGTSGSTGHRPQLSRTRARQANGKTWLSWRRGCGGGRWSSFGNCPEALR